MKKNLCECIPLTIISHCKTHLFFSVSVSDNHILGQKVQRGKTEGMLQVLVFVENRGEESYESMLNITLPPGVSFFRITNRKYVSCFIYLVGFVY